MELGNKIRSLRLRAGMTQEMLAEELGVSFQTISKWENGVCAPVDEVNAEKQRVMELMRG